MTFKFVIPLLLSAQTVWADCAQTEDLFMSCEFDNGKSVQLCTDGNTAHYRYGAQQGEAELALSLRFGEGAEMVPWNGVGRSIWEAVRLTNNDITYEVYGGFDKQEAVEWDPDTEISPVFGGIVVEDVDGAEIAHLRCVPGTVDYGF